MPSYNKVMPHDQDTDFHTFTIAITPISIKIIKGVHLLTPRPNMLLNQQDENTAEKKKERIADLLN